MTKLLAKEAVHYRRSEHPDRKCSTCAMYQPTDHHCDLVSGWIQPDMVCDRFTKKDEAKTGDESTSAKYATPRTGARAVEVRITRAGVCTGDGPCDSSQVGPGPNWVTKTDPTSGLGKYLHAIVHALQRSGHSESDAIRLAIGIVRRWASGQGNVTAATRARAAKALAEWEALKAKNKARPKGRSVAEDQSAYAEGRKDAASGEPCQSFAQFDATHPGADADDYPLYVAGYYGDDQDAELALKPTLATRSPKPRHKPSDPQKCKFGDHPATKSLIWAEGAAYVPVCEDHEQTAIDKIGGPSEVNKVIPIREGALVTRAVGEWGSSGPDTSYGGAGSQYDPTSAGTMLPVGPVGKPKPRQAQTVGPHAFVGRNLSKCQKCGQPATARVHTRNGNRSADPKAPGLRPHTEVGASPQSDWGFRHRGPVGHHPVGTGHVKGDLKRYLSAHRALYDVHATQLEEPLTADLQKLFAEQQRSVLSRLQGKRGKQMFKRAGYRADQPEPGGTEPGEPPEVGDNGAVTPPGASIDPSAIFDATFWNDKLADVLQPYYDQAAGLTAQRISSTLPLPPEFDGAASTSAAAAFLANRGNMTSPKINDTTYQAIVGQLQEGAAAGEGLQKLAGRVRDVFDQASRVRARRIAQTEVLSALNGSAYAYASALPEGTVNRKRWQSHHDDRVRAAHRVADGQTVPLTAPFMVGGFPAQYPGDPSLPPELCINCRCALIPLPPEMAADAYEKVAAAIHLSMAKANGVTLAPAAQTYLTKVAAA